MGLQRTPPPTASAAPLLPRPVPPAYLSPSARPAELAESAPETEPEPQMATEAAPTPTFPQASSSKLTLDAASYAPSPQPSSARVPTSKRGARGDASPPPTKSARRQAPVARSSTVVQSPPSRKVPEAMAPVAAAAAVPGSPRPAHAVPVAAVQPMPPRAASSVPQAAPAPAVIPPPALALPAPPLASNRPSAPTGGISSEALPSAPAPASVPVPAPMPISTRPSSDSAPAPPPASSARTSARNDEPPDAQSKHYDMLCQALEVAVRKGANKWTVKDLKACFPTLAEANPAAFEQVWETIAKALREKMLADAHATFLRVNLPKSLKLFREMLEQGVPAGEDKPDAYQAHLQPNVAVTAAMLPIWDDLWAELREDYIKSYEHAAQLADEVAHKQRRLAELEAEIQASTVELDATVKILEDVPSEGMQAWMGDVMGTLGRAGPLSGA